MLALVRACREGRVPAQVVGVGAHSLASPALELARSEGLTTFSFPLGDDGAGLIAELERAGADWLCLAGYLKLLPRAVIERLEGRVLNIHPALLPKFGGPGMYGRRVHEAVLASGDTESGCTVHYVSPTYDEGQIAHQVKCPVLAGDTPETLAERVLMCEHRAYAEALLHVLESAATPPPLR